jgi:hypothetical protein
MIHGIYIHPHVEQNQLAKVLCQSALFLLRVLHLLRLSPERPPLSFCQVDGIGVEMPGGATRRPADEMAARLTKVEGKTDAKGKEAEDQPDDAIPERG